jgi:hypothetical protein
MIKIWRKVNVVDSIKLKKIYIPVYLFYPPRIYPRDKIFFCLSEICTEQEKVDQECLKISSLHAEGVFDFE